MDVLPSARLAEQEVDGGHGGFHVHELRFAFGRGDFVFPEFVAVSAGKIALVGQIHDQRLQREVLRRIGQRFAHGITRDDDVRMIEFREEFVRVTIAVPGGDEFGHQLVVIGMAGSQSVQQFFRGAIQFENSAGGHQIQKAPAAALEGMKFAGPVGSCFRRGH